VEAPEDIVEAREDVLKDTEGIAKAITGATIMATVMAFLGDLDMVGGVILTGGITLTGGTTLTILTIIPTTILIITIGVMRSRRPLQKGWLRHQNQENSSLLFGTSVRTRRVTILTSKIAPGVG
jgi:hypothetical protein